MVRQTGGPEVLRLEDAPDPEPGEGQVLVRVEVAAINPIEYKQRNGIVPKELPAILGSDFSGVVERSLATELQEGAEVFGFAGSGAYAELAVTPVSMVAEKPEGVSHEAAAALPVAAMTAYQALFDRGRLEGGQRVLIAGAAGGVGGFAVQLASRAGAHVIGVGSARNRDYVMSLGATGYVDYTTEDVTQAIDDVDLAFDAVGGATTQALLATVREGGTLVGIAGAMPETDPSSGIRAELLIMSPSREQLVMLADLVARDELKVEIAERFPLADAAKAHEMSESGRTRGKILLDVAG
ncbi:MAG TPA: NADP-dependent oxidoreductase [Solirubrobacteraceae bacterium]|nr:NADP-dependent oxidoreductase [Solirubrobacteraceae bacterium]